MSVAPLAQEPSAPDPAVIRAEVLALIRFTGEVADWIAGYTERLDHERPRDLGAEHEKMRRMATLYDERSGRLIRSAPDLGEILPAETAELKAVTLRFQHNLAACTAKLKARRTVGDWLIRAVGEEVAKRANPVQRYDRSATLQRSAASAPTPPLAVNRTI